MKVLPANKIKPEIDFLETNEVGIILKDLKSNKIILVPWYNIIEVMLKEEPKPRGRPKKDVS